MLRAFQVGTSSISLNLFPFQFSNPTHVFVNPFTEKQFLKYLKYVFPADNRCYRVQHPGNLSIPPRTATSMTSRT